jgi:hypothetical protein
LGNAGTTFYIFPNKEQGKTLFKMPKTKFLGGFFALLNPIFTGYFRGVPLLELEEPAVPIMIANPSSLRMEQYHSQIVDEPKVTFLLFTSVII